jgi:hypothetical protein
MTKRDEAAARCEIYPRAVAWILQNVKAIEPFTIRGQLGLFDVEISQDRLVARKAPMQQSFFD